MRSFAAVSALLLAAPASAFLAPMRLSSAAPSTTRRGDMRCQLALDDLNAGITAPLGKFDPLGFSEGKSSTELKKLREAELKHGRVAMLATLGFLVQEKLHPLFGFAGKEMGPAIEHFQEIQAVYPLFWTGLLFGVALIESKTISNGWQSPADVAPGDIAGLREDYIAGDLGLDPFNLRNDPEAFLTMRAKEVNNGRLAMIAAIAMMVQELVSNGETLAQQTPLLH